MNPERRRISIAEAEAATAKVRGDTGDFDFGEDGDDEEEEGDFFATPGELEQHKKEVVEKERITIEKEIAEKKATIEKNRKNPTAAEMAMRELLFSEQGLRVQSIYNPELPPNPNRKQELQKLTEVYEKPPLSNMEKQKIELMGQQFDNARDSFYTKYSEDDLANYTSGANQNEMQFLIERNPNSAKILSASVAGKGIKARKALEIISRMQTLEDSTLSPEFKKDLIDIKLELNPELINALPEEMQIQEVFENPTLLRHTSREAQQKVLETTPPEKFAEMLGQLEVNNLDLLTEIEGFQNNQEIMRKLVAFAIQGPDHFLKLPNETQDKVFAKMDEPTKKQFINSARKFIKTHGSQKMPREIERRVWQA
ncbi:MAG: hypothetical protein L3J07_03665 [Candidatus Magasanikbacteria bacterium]|nr:hypothetical protein [Candidatus Magasanikbacteria bacterium]